MNLPQEVRDDIRSMLRHEGFRMELRSECGNIDAGYSHDVASSIHRIHTDAVGNRVAVHDQGVVSDGRESLRDALHQSFAVMLYPDYLSVHWAFSMDDAGSGYGAQGLMAQTDAEDRNPTEAGRYGLP